MAVKIRIVVVTRARGGNRQDGGWRGWQLLLSFRTCCTLS